MQVQIQELHEAQVNQQDHEQHQQEPEPDQEQADNGEEHEFME